VGIGTRKLSVTLFSTLETNNVTSDWSVNSLSFFYSSQLYDHHIAIFTSDCVDHDNILSSLVLKTHDEGFG